MKKFLFVLLFLNLPIFFSESTRAMEESNIEDSQDFASGVRKINDNLYFGKKEAGLYFVMERVDLSVSSTLRTLFGQPKVFPGQRLMFWQEYVCAENKNHNEYKRKWQNDEIPYGKGFLVFKDRGSGLSGGLTSFEQSVNYVNSNNELWIAYASSKAIEKADDITFDDIEMAVTVLTDKDAPMVTHMGISRSFRYLLKSLERYNKIKWATDLSEEKRREFGVKIPSDRKFKLHSNLAMDLHSFSAKVMRLRDPRKLYMITAPLPQMREIMLKALPEHAYVGDSLEFAKEIYRKIPGSNKSLKSKAIFEETRKLSEEIKLLQTQIWECEENEERERDGEINKLKELKKEKEKKRKELSKEFELQQKKEIQEIADKLGMTKEMSPIKRSLIPQGLQIFDRNRKAIVFDHNKDSQTIRLADQELTGEETKRFDWFYHRDMGLNPYATIDLYELSTHMTLLWNPSFQFHNEQITLIEKEQKKTKKLEEQFVKTKLDRRLFLYLRENRSDMFRDKFKKAVEHRKIEGNEDKWIKIASYFNRGNILRDIVEMTNVKIESLYYTRFMILGKKELSDLLREFYRPGDEAIVEELIKLGADVNATDYFGRTSLSVVASIPERDREGRKNSLTMVELLLSKKADSNITNRPGQTPLHFAAEYGNTEIASLLIRGGAEVNTQARSQGYSPLHYAAERRHADTVKLLLEHGAETDITTEWGKTPLDVAGNEETREVLRSFNKAK